MANVTITKLQWNTPAALPTGITPTADTSIGSGLYAKIPVDQDERILIKVDASASDTVKVLAGDHYGKADEDLVVLSSASGSKIFCIESTTYGKKGGFIIIEAGAATSKVSAIKLA